MVIFQMVILHMVDLQYGAACLGSCVRLTIIFVWCLRSTVFAAGHFGSVSRAPHNPWILQKILLRAPLPHSAKPIITAIQFRKAKIHFNNSYLFSGFSALVKEYYDSCRHVNNFFKFMKNTFM